MFKKTLIAAALAVAATGSFAQVYVQGAIGSGTVDISAGSSGATSVKKTSTGNKFAVGYEFGNGWAAEGMLINFGKNVPTFANGTSAEMKATSMAIGGVYAFDLSNGHGLKIGAYYGSNKADISGSAVAASAVGSQTKGNFNLGLGYAYSFNKTTAITVDYDSGSFKNDKVVVGNFNASLLSVGVRYKF